MKSEENKYPLLESVHPTECLGFRINRVSRVLNKIYRSHLKELKITLSQLNILFALGKNKDIYQTEVAQFLKLDPSTLTRDLERLIAKGYVQKSGYANKPTLNLTKSGYVYLEKVIPYWQKAQEEAKKFVGKEGISSINFLIENI